MRERVELKLKSKTSKQSMNILFYARMEFESDSTHLVHIYELSSNLSKLGHNLIIAEVVHSKNKGFGFRHGSLLDRIKHLELRLFLLTLITLLRQKTKPEVIYMRHGGLFCTGYFIAKLLRIPLVTEVNGIVIDELQVMGHKNNILLWLVDKIERFNLSRANKIVVIQNGANTDLFKPMDSVKARTELALNKNNSYICFVGTLSPHQGVEYLIKCAPLVLKKCSSAQFIIVGFGKWEQELKNLAEQMGVADKFIFTGAVPYEKVPLYINACDVCVVPRKPWRLGYSPLKLHEYMACGKPVVATRTDGFEDIEKYNAGILINPENVDEFANAIIKLIQNEEFKEKMGRNGMEYVVKYHSWESVARRVAEVCEDVIR